MARGLKVDEFAPRLSFFFNAHNDFFEEIAKYRAARRIWARHMREKYAAQDPRSWMLRTHAQTAGASLTAQQPEINIIRTAYQALAAVLGGTQSLHTNSMDEALALPSEKAATIALRTQQIMAEETGVANTIDPLGGSFFVEALTDRMEAEAEAYFERIEALGGVLPSIEAGFFQREIAESAFRYQQEIDRGERTIVGVNDYISGEPLTIPILEMDPQGYERQVQRLCRVRAERDLSAVQQALSRLADAARGDVNLMQPILDAVNAYATLGEICGVFRQVFGEYQEPVYF
jgi:methylmalonyl-CoA mutase N-terminal domain/subunit